MECQQIGNANERAKLYYMTIFAQCFSPCGKYLVAANNYGKIAVFNISKILNSDRSQVDDKDLKYPIFTFDAHNGPVYALTSTDNFLISAGVGDILAWCWTDIYNKHIKIAWSLTIPESDNLGKPETNAIILSEDESSPSLYSGGGDNNIYEWDLETRKRKNTFKGHTDYIHCLTTSNQGECVSGSEDGSVRIWDFRKPTKEVVKIEPYKSELCSRSKFGKWIGCVAMDQGNDWLICGGGPSLTLWHLASLNPTTSFTCIENTLACCGFHDDLVIAGGGDSNFYHMQFDGSLKAKIPTSSTSIYSVVLRNELAVVAGTSHMIDACPSFTYRDFILYFT